MSNEIRDVCKRVKHCIVGGIYAYALEPRSTELKHDRSTAILVG